MITWLQGLGAIDPSPLFAASLLPYLLFLRWIGQSRCFHPLTLWGFRLTLLFVGITIAAAVVALFVFDAELVAVDPLHGGAEAFLTLSNGLIVAGLLKRSAQEEASRMGE